ncbi:hypothetical protein H4219_003178 [Mycoemilia scoparia]|uniref:Nucleoside phosphorylase domain-containing protein n=1 Tax=Mycoemilia scoparia TaxID=417184 RepID=A0A9W8DT20_9FUNG|nr:hypothetical protein H4219_003178 [Mycoemilia scoparia]
MPSQELHNANFPVDTLGRTYHVEVKPGDVANRIITVGDPARAKQLSKSLDEVVFEHMSHRGFLTITGIYRGVPISIIAIGMGFANMDFFIREVRAIVDGPMSVIRLGSCGSLSKPKPGDIIVADSTYGIVRNFDYFTDSSSPSDKPYIISKDCSANPGLNNLLKDNLLKKVSADSVFFGSVGSADSFYSSQGRLDPTFHDDNQTLIQDLIKDHPDRIALEMEAHMLYHLANCSKAPGKAIKASCVLMVYMDRTGNGVITPQQAKQSLEICTKSILDTLVEDLLDQQKVRTILMFECEF